MSAGFFKYFFLQLFRCGIDFKIHKRNDLNPNNAIHIKFNWIQPRKSIDKRRFYCDLFLLITEIHGHFIGDRTINMKSPTQMKDA